MAYDPNNPNNPYTLEDPECDGMTNAGAIHVFTSVSSGPTNLLLSSAQILITGDAQDRRLGLYCFANVAHDIDGDAIDDLIVADVDDWMILFGSTSLVGTQVLSQTSTRYIAPAYPTEQPVVADMNGDALFDLAYFDTNRASSMYIYGTYGIISATSTNYGLDGFGRRGRAVSATVSSGTVFSSAGDVNGDGYEDLLVGESWNVNTLTPTNTAYLYLSSPTTVASNGTVIDNTCFYQTNYQCPTFTSVSFTTSNTADEVGESVAGVGDVNGDGYDDILIGAPGKQVNGQTTGAAYLVFGSASPTSLTLSNATVGVIEFVGSALYGDCVGSAVGAAGDLNNDGYDDLIIGSSCNDMGGVINRGAAYVFSGYAQIPTTGVTYTLISSSGYPMLTASRNVTIYLGKTMNDELGSNVGPAGDMDNDGLLSFFMNSPNNSDGAPQGGKFWVFEWRSSIAPLVVP